MTGRSHDITVDLVLIMVLVYSQSRMSPFFSDWNEDLPPKVMGFILNGTNYYLHEDQDGVREISNQLSRGC